MSRFVSERGSISSLSAALMDALRNERSQNIAPLARAMPA